MSRALRVAVVGAGISGLCCAYYLRQRDFDVVVVDREEVGSRRASSFGNGGWICPAQAGPLPAPGLTIYGLRALLNADSSLYFKPSHLPKLVPWLARFWTYCNERDFEHGTEALAELGRPIFQMVDEMLDDGIEFELYKMGMICATADPKDARAVLDSLAPMRRFGYDLPDDLLYGDDLYALEPALTERVTAGFHYDDQWHVRPTTMTTGIAAKLRSMGVQIVSDAAVEGFDKHDETLRALRTTAGEFTADAFVLAAGSWTQPLSAKLGSRFPMEPGKGYSFFVKPVTMPKHGILFPDIHAGATPLGDLARISGTMEFSGYNLDIDERRIDHTYRALKEYLKLDEPHYREPWTGMRPMTPDGLPVIDRAQPYRNVYVATGYSMLGMTVAPPAGKAIVDFIDSGERPRVLEPFRVDRFHRFPLRRSKAEHEAATSAGIPST
jgi:D-amino-acid dehydrogenase